MLKLMKCELGRTAKDSAALIAAGIIIAFGALYADPSVLGANDPLLPSAIHDVEGMFMSEAADAGVAFLLLGAATVCYLTGRQFSDRTVNLEIAAGHGRAKVFATRCATCLLFPAVLALLALVAGILRSSASLPLAEPGAEAYLFRSMFLLLPPLIALASCTTLFIAVFRDSARSTAATLVFLFLMLWAMALLMPPSSFEAGTAYAAAPNVLLFLHPAYLVRLVLMPDLECWQAVLAVFVSIGWTVAFVGLAWIVLRRCELR